MARRNIRLTLAYNGYAYNGWQRQKSDPSVQLAVEKAIEAALLDTVSVTGAGRTDAGAHGLCYTANFYTKNTSIPVGRVPSVLNRALPDDIRVTGAEDVPEAFHSRISASAREYIYLMAQAGSDSPFLNRFCHTDDRELDTDRIREICPLFKGTHSFNNFSSGYDETMDFARTIYYFRARVIPAGRLPKLLPGSRCGPVILFFIKGSGFLNGMIRSIISVCLNYSLGKISKDDVLAAIDNRTRLDPRFRTPVPACGLYFKRAYYPR